MSFNPNKYQVGDLVTSKYISNSIGIILGPGKTYQKVVVHWIIPDSILNREYYKQGLRKL